MKRFPGDIILLQICTINKDHRVKYHILQMCTINKDHIAFLKYKARQKIVCHFWLVFGFSPPGNLENQTFETLKKISGDITILHMYHK